MEVIIVGLLGLFASTVLLYFYSKTKRDNSQLKENLHLIEKEKILLTAQLQQAEHNVQRDRELFKSLQADMENHFRGMAAQALEGSSKQFLELAKSTFQKHSQQAESLLNQKEVNIENLVKPLQLALNDLSKQSHAMEKERVAVFASLEGEIKRVIESNSLLARETLALKDALKKPHVRGRWGEVQLKNCIELAGMSEYCDVSFQTAVTDEENQKLIPDMTVRMPGGRTVVVDAKTPLDAFISALEAQDESEKMAQISRHGRHVKEHVKKLSAKDYAKAVVGSADFT
ncbi:MAG: DNA recombination protein RmuC, partial [Bdellovibrionales bacterium]|nr:DNA recombination protein RmuC [Bdellovibrionales bacterium]